jgi:hypothetical protein
MDLTELLGAIANLDHTTAVALLDATPALATAGLARRDEFFLAERLAQVYESDTACSGVAAPKTRSSIRTLSRKPARDAISWWR